MSDIMLVMTATMKRPKQVFLSPAERRLFQQCEEQIVVGMLAYFNTGQAMQTIRDKKLYRASHETFSDYCQDRWGLKSAQVRRYIDAATVVTENPDAEALPMETASYLAKFTPEEREILIPQVSKVGKRAARVIIARERAVTTLRKTQEREKLLTQASKKKGKLYSVHYGDNAIAPTLVKNVDAIITDAPYSDRDAKKVYAGLGAIARETLKPGGSLIVMTSQRSMYEAHFRLRHFLRYYWTLAYVMNGGAHARPLMYEVEVGWKPLLWFIQGDTYEGERVSDVVEANWQGNAGHGSLPQQHLHSQGQSIKGMEALVERFTKPGDTILDPFLGSGTTGVAAVKLKRKFVGIDKNEENVQIAATLLDQVS